MRTILDPLLPPVALRCHPDPHELLSPAERARFEPLGDPANLRRLLAAVLDRDPGNLWALVNIAERTESTFERELFFREAVRVAWQIYASGIWRQQGDPARGTDKDDVFFVRAMNGLCRDLFSKGHIDEAKECLRHLSLIDIQMHRAGRSEAEFAGLGLMLDDEGDEPEAPGTITLGRNCL